MDIRTMIACWMLCPRLVCGAVMQMLDPVDKYMLGRAWKPTSATTYLRKLPISAFLPIITGDDFPHLQPDSVAILGNAMLSIAHARLFGISIAQHTLKQW